MNERKVLISLTEYNELVNIKKSTPKLIIQYTWNSMYPTIILDGHLPDEVIVLVDAYNEAKPQMERLKKVPKWILKLFGA